MNPLPYILAPILLLPAVTAPLPDRGGPDRGVLERAGDGPAAESSRSDAALFESRIDDGGGLTATLSFPNQSRFPEAQDDPAQQVRIEQSITVRIAPRGPGRMDPRITAFEDYQARDSRPRLVEKKMAKCVPVQGVAGVQISPGNKLVLYLHDSRIVSAGLDKGCNARDFYSGFYVARSADGMMCSGRDKLQARNGASCKLGKMKQIVAAGD
jgi:hypothetical protein